MSVFQDLKIIVNNILNIKGLNSNTHDEIQNLIIYIDDQEKYYNMIPKEFNSENILNIITNNIKYKIDTTIYKNNIERKITDIINEKNRLERNLKSQLSKQNKDPECASALEKTILENKTLKSSMNKQLHAYNELKNFIAITELNKDLSIKDTLQPNSNNIKKESFCIIL